MPWNEALHPRNVVGEFAKASESEYKKRKRQIGNALEAAKDAFAGGPTQTTTTRLPGTKTTSQSQTTRRTMAKGYAAQSSRSDQRSNYKRDTDQLRKAIKNAGK